MKPRYYHSGMTGAPGYVAGIKAYPTLVKACLVDGFNVRAPSSAVAADGVLTLNYSAAPGYDLLSWVRVEGAAVPQANGDWQVTVVSGNQIAVEIDGLPDGSVGGSLSTKVAPAGWYWDGFPTDSQGWTIVQGASADMPRRGFRFFQNTVAPRITGYNTVDMVAKTVAEPFPTAVQQSFSDVRILGHASGAYGSADWFVVATDRWAYFGTTIGPVLGFCGDLAHRTNPGDAHAAVLAGIASAADTALCYLPGRLGAYVSQVGDDGRFFKALTGRKVWPDTHNALLPYVPVYETGGSANLVRGVLPNAYQASAQIVVGSGGTAGQVVSDIAGVAGRVVLFGSGLAISLDEEAWPL